ncbi:MAG: hypothetical protein SPJ13_00860 [Bacteroidales bacterium]|nr:hypothetical protein [Bacteroidales bacterium]
MKRTLILFTLMAFVLSVAAQNQMDEQGRRQGYWLKTDKNGNKMFEGTFKDGQETGVFTYYYPNGKVRLRNTFSVPGIYCRHEAFDEEGRMLAEGFYNQKNRDSVWRFYNEKGMLVKIGSYRMGIKEGVQVIFNSDGDTAEYSTWRDNHREGRWWKRVGKKGYITGTYRHGGPDGRMVEYDENGKLCRDGNYKNGEKEGKYQYFDNGVLTVDEHWSNGNLVSRSILATTPSGKQYVATTSIAYIYPRQQQTAIFLMDGKIIVCNETVETLSDRIGFEKFVLIDQKSRIIANVACIQGLTRTADGRQSIALEPKPAFEVFPSEETQKMVQSLMRGGEGMPED